MRASEDPVQTVSDVSACFGNYVNVLTSQFQFILDENHIAAVACAVAISFPFSPEEICELLCSWSSPQKKIQTALKLLELGCTP